MAPIGSQPSRIAKRIQSNFKSHHRLTVPTPLKGPKHNMEEWAEQGKTELCQDKTQQRTNCAIPVWCPGLQHAWVAKHMPLLLATLSASISPWYMAHIPGISYILDSPLQRGSSCTALHSGLLGPPYRDSGPTPHCLASLAFWNLKSL